jgi:hypothetical protein
MQGVVIGAEIGARKTFVWVVDWPGWSRGGKTLEDALAALVAARPRYARVAERAGMRLPALDGEALQPTFRVEGGSGTDFGIPYESTDDDRRPVDARSAERLAALVRAAWAEFDAVAARTPPVLRKGPRGGGRDRDTVLEHVNGADHAYAREIGIRLPGPSLADRGAVEALRRAVLEVLAAPSDGTPLAGRKWPLRYAARRIAWHALDHAWEMEDRAEPA